MIFIFNQTFKLDNLILNDYGGKIMQKSLYRKIFVFGIVLFFVGINVVPNSTGDIIEIKHNSTNLYDKNLYDDGNEPGNHNSIQEIIDDVKTDEMEICNNYQSQNFTKHEKSADDVFPELEMEENR